MELPLHGIPAALTVVLAEDGAPVYVAKNIFDLGTFDLVVDQLGSGVSDHRPRRGRGRGVVHGRSHQHLDIRRMEPLSRSSGWPPCKRCPVVLDLEGEPREGGAPRSARPPTRRPARRLPRGLPRRSTRRTRGRTCRARTPTSSGSGSGAAAVEVPGAAVDRLVAACREHDVLCAIGVNERETANGPARSTTPSCCSGPTACLSRHRKLMPTHHERLFHGVGAGDDLGVDRDRRWAASAG